MLIQFSEKFNYNSLKNLIRINKIKYTYSLNKKNLLVCLNKHKSVTYIQNVLRSKIKKECTCPISYEPIKYPFVSFYINKKFIYYNLECLVEYFKKTDNFKDPCTRVPITDQKIRYMNNMIRYYYGKNSKKILISPNMKKNTELNIITYCLYDLVSELRDIKEIKLDTIYNNVLPRLIYYIHILIKNHEKSEVLTIINACKESILNFNLENTILLVDYFSLITILNYPE